MANREFSYNPDGSRRQQPSSRQLEQQRGGRESRIVNGPPRDFNPPSQKSRVQESAGSTLPWRPESDRRFFKAADSPIRFQSSDYYEFQHFFQRFLLHRSKKAGLLTEEMPASHSSLSSIFDPSRASSSSSTGPSLSLDAEQLAIAECIPLFQKFLADRRVEQGSAVSRQRRLLPVFACRESLLDMIRRNQVTIIAAETGAGKSTQIPQYLLEDGLTRIVCTQPRRIACVSLAQRVQKERMGSIGSSSDDVGYQIRFEKSYQTSVSKSEGGENVGGPKLLFLTEGILLRQIRSDPLLSQYNVIIIDEVHERHAMIDFLLGLLKKVLPIRQDLKLVLMSATIQAELFSKYFDNAPLINVPGKTFPVTINYCPPIFGGIEQEDINLVDERMIEERLKIQVDQGFVPSIPVPSQRLDGKPYLEILQRIDYEYPSNEQGHLLIFLPGYQEIQQVYNILEPYANECHRWIILKLHSALSMKSQDRVFMSASSGVRKCILSTNIAETSVTLPGIRFIIDSGRVKELEWDPSLRMQKLNEVWVSQASARQRAGRAGRTGPGVCFRLYSEREYGCLNEYSTAELVRGLALDQMILQMKAMPISGPTDSSGFLVPGTKAAVADTSDPRKFDFLQKPPAKHVEETIQLLQQLRALNDSEDITLLGNTLSLLPLDVILGKMLVIGKAFGMTDWSMLMAAGLSVSSPFLREDGNQQQSSLSMGSETEYSRDPYSYDWEKEKKSLMMAEGDPFTLIMLLQSWINVQRQKKVQSRKWCSKMAIEEQRLYEMVKLIYQFKSTIGMDNSEYDGNGVGEKRKYNFGGRDAYNRWQREKHSTREKSEKLLTSHNDDVEDDDVNEPDMMLLEFNARHHIDELFADFASLPFHGIRLAEKILLQLVLCSALYPNIAIPDEGNASRRVADHVFHTKFKRFVLIHPTSVFSKHPEWVPSLKASSSYAREDAMSGTSSMKVSRQIAMAEDGDMDLVDMHDIASKFDRPSAGRKKFNSEEQIAPRYPSFLCYVQLMETTKPYLMNVFSVPALLSAFLFGHVIDTNADLSVIVIDEWIVIEFKSLKRFMGTDHSAGNPITPIIADIIRRLVKFREEWNQRIVDTLREKFSNKFSVHQGLGASTNPGPCEIANDVEKFLPAVIKSLHENLIADHKTLSPRSRRPVSEFLRHLESILALDDYMHEKGVYYEMDTVKDDDISTIYPATFASSDIPETMHLPPKWSYEKEKVGIALSSYLNFGSVHYPQSLLRIMDSSVKSDEPHATNNISIGSRRSVKRVWECSKCGKAMMITEADFNEHFADCLGPVSVQEVLASPNLTSLPSTQPIVYASVPVAKTPIVADGKCAKCGQMLPQTPLERLKHKKLCAKYS